MKSSNRGSRFLFGLLLSVWVLGLSAVTFEARAQSSCPDIFALESALFQREPLPLDREPLFAKDRALELARETDLIGDYSLLTIGLSKDVHLKVIVDTKADWLIHAVETFAKKPAATLDQKSIKAFLDSLTTTDLRSLLRPNLRMYRGQTRELKRDGETYYLEELIASGSRRDLVIAILGQSLLESFAKKPSRIVSVRPEGAAAASFGLMIMNGNPDVFIPGKCANAACGANTVVQSAKIKSASAPTSPGNKDKKQISVIDFQGQSRTLNVVTRSAIERTVKEERDIYAAAQPDDLVPIEIYHMVAYLAGGTTMFRVGDDMYHFGGAGWEHGAGAEGVKGFLLSNPFQKRMYRSYRGMGIPPFNVGIQLMVPKHLVERAKLLIDAQMALPDSQKPRFNFIRNNCVQVLLRIFKSAGLNLGDPNGFNGFSSSLTFRNLFLGSQFAVRSRNIYPLPGVDLTEAQYRSEFPQFIYRAYNVKEDRRLAYLPALAKARYQEAILLAAVEMTAGQDYTALAKVVQDSGIIEQESDLGGRLDIARTQGWLTADLRSVTPLGQAILAERSVDYDLSALLAP